METEVKKKSYPYLLYAGILFLEQALLCSAAVVFKLPYLCHMKMLPAVVIMAAATAVNTFLFPLAICMEKKGKALYIIIASLVPIAVLCIVGGFLRCLNIVLFGCISLAFVIIGTAIYASIYKLSVIPVNDEDKRLYIFIRTLKSCILFFIVSSLFFIPHTYFDDFSFINMDNVLVSSTIAKAEPYSMDEYKRDIDEKGSLTDHEGMKIYSMDKKEKIGIFQKIANQTAYDIGCSDAPKVAAAWLYDPFDMLESDYLPVYYDAKNDTIYLNEAFNLNEGDLRNIVYQVCLRDLFMNGKKDAFDKYFYDEDYHDYALNKAEQYRAYIDKIQDHANRKAAEK